MNALCIFIISVIVLLCGYLFYGRWLAKQWGLDDRVKTPAHTKYDGKDYCPAKPPVLIGHHFASIAGAGPITGPIAAAIFGWVPVLLWILVGGIFFGAKHDFVALFASIRHGGKSIGNIIEENMGRRCKRLFIVFAYITLLLVVAAFGSIVVSTFESGTGEAMNISNGRTATTSLLFIILAVVFGFIVHRSNSSLVLSSIIGITFLVLCIIIGYNFPLHLPASFWSVFVMAYIVIASVTPVWILLQPRDYLNSFLLYGMLILAVIGIFAAQPEITLPAITDSSVSGDQYIFPFLFITVACGAISGFHSLVSSGTTSKQLNKESDALKIGYGAMMIECLLAVISVICVAILFGNSNLTVISESGMPSSSATVVFATGIAYMLESVGLPYDVMYSVLILAVSAFCLTSLDTATRLARYMLQEFVLDKEETVESVKGIKKYIANPYIATIITVVLGALLMTNGYNLIWPLFGASNQLLAALALLACTSWLEKIGKNGKMLYFPMVFMLCATMTSLVETFYLKSKNLILGSETIVADILQLFFSGVLVVLAIFLVIEAYQTHRRRKKQLKS